MNKHNREMLELISDYKAQIRIDNLINDSLDQKMPTEVYYRLFNLYSVLDTEDLLIGDK